MRHLAGEIEIEFNTGNAAFKDDPLELRRILERAEHAIVELSQQSAMMRRRRDLLDSNGDTVGFVAVYM